MAPPIDVSRFEQLKASGDLPSPKGVALAIMRLTQQDDVSMAEMANVIRTDPAFVGRLVKAANGIIGYGRRPVASVQDALTVLGLPAVRTMALGFSLLNNYRSGACDGFDYQGYWSSSLLSAVAIQAITLRTRVAAPDEAYCLGLLARVGELALATLYPHDYSRILEEVKGDRRRRLEQESVTFAMTSAELGAAMLSDWGLPRLFSDAAFVVASEAVHECLDESRAATVALSLSIARHIADLCLAPQVEQPSLMKRLQQEASRLSLDEEATLSLSDGVVTEWLEWGALLNIHVERPLSFSKPEKSSNILEEASVAEESSSSEKKVEELITRILLVEQDPQNRAKHKDILCAGGGCEITEAGEGFAALELALDFQPDMMLVEQGLPDMPCAELIRTLRRTRIGRSIYILVLAGDSVGADISIDFFQAGADDILHEPVNDRLLLARIRAGLRMTALHHEIEQDREELRHFAAELAVSNRRLQEAAMMDALTGFPNRRYFSDRLQQEWVASSRSRRPLSCLMVDVDNFKDINDVYGHDVGDEVLRQVSVAIRAALRSQDVVARTGGDEFLILCPDTSIDAALVCAERVRQGVFSAQISSGATHVKVEISVGAACRDQSMSDAESLLKRADQGLYAAKQAGRNQVASLQAGVA